MGRPCAAPGRRAALTRRPAFQFDAPLGRRKLLEQLQAASLAAWNAEELPHAHAAAAALLAYAEHTQGRALTHVRALVVERAGEAAAFGCSSGRPTSASATWCAAPKPTSASSSASTAVPTSVR